MWRTGIQKDHAFAKNKTYEKIVSFKGIKFILVKIM
jgi:hypothetical protein